MQRSDCQKNVYSLGTCLKANKTIDSPNEKKGLHIISTHIRRKKLSLKRSHMYFI